jgi:hypothetical protein
MIMCRKLICLTASILVLSLAGNGFAANFHWNGGAGDRDFSNPANWREGAVPGPGDLAFQWPPGQGGGATTEGPIIDETVTVATAGIGWKWAHAVEDTPTVIWEIVHGGELTVTESVILGRQNAWGQLDITGGKLTANNLQVGTGGTSVGKINLDGGTLEVTGALTFGGGGSDNIDIAGGTLTSNSNNLETIQAYIDDPNDFITAYGGNGTLHLDYDDVTNQTTLTALHNFNPYPADGGGVVAGAVELSWTVDEGMPVDVWFGTNPGLVAAELIVAKESVTSIVVQTQPKTQYYWAVDTYIGDPNDPIFGSVFSFIADNLPPKVEAGANAVTWLVDGVMTKNLDATITDDDAYTVQWTVVSEPDDPNSPDAVIADPTAEDTAITLSAYGEYVLQLEASDGEYRGRDTVTINVYHDGCEAAQSLPDYEPVVGDLNGDCKVDELDLAMLEENWLIDNSLIDP